MNVNHIPAQPLLDYIENMGGAHLLPGFGVPAHRSPEAMDYLARDRNPSEQRRLTRLRNRLNVAKRMGIIGYYIADAICCGDLRVHPMAVYGETWLEFTSIEDDNEKELALA